MDWQVYGVDERTQYLFRTLTKARDGVIPNLKNEMKKLTKLQLTAILEWDGESILSVTPDGGVIYQTFKQSEQQNSKAENFDCADKFLDSLNIPRQDPNNGKTFSVVGRIAYLQKQAAKIIEMT